MQNVFHNGMYLADLPWGETHWNALRGSLRQTDDAVIFSNEMGLDPDRIRFGTDGVPA
jgi:hypothetical protein